MPFFSSFQAVNCRNPNSQCGPLFWGQVKGWEEPIFGGKYREKVVGSVRKYSDRLLELRARAMLPAYRETQAIAVNKKVTHEVDAGVLGDAVAQVAAHMVQSRRDLPAPAKVIEHDT